MLSRRKRRMDSVIAIEAVGSLSVQDNPEHQESEAEEPIETDIR